jgi:hypothetical protein
MLTGFAVPDKYGYDISIVFALNFLFSAGAFRNMKCENKIDRMLWETILRDQAAYLVHLGYTLLHQAGTNPVVRLHILLLYSLDRNKAHIGPTHRFTDRFCISGVILVALHVRFDELWRNQFYGIAMSL